MRFILQILLIIFLVAPCLSTASEPELLIHAEENLINSGTADKGKNSPFSSESISFAKGVKGYSLDLSDDSSSVDLGKLSSNSEFTVSFWVKGKDGGTIFVLASSLKSNLFGIAAERGVLNVAYTGANGWLKRGVKLKQILSSDKWNFVSCVSTGLKIKVYIDGALAASKKYECPGFVHTSAVIGGSENLGMNNFRGQIDEFRFYNRALTEKEIVELYYNETPYRNLAIVNRKN